MPGLQFKELPSSGSPHEIVQRNYNDMQGSLQRQYKMQVSALERQYLTDRDFKNKLVALQVEYKTAMSQQQAKAQQRTGELQIIQRLIDQGAIDPHAGKKAMWRVILPAEAHKAMFPTGGTFSPGQIKSYRESMIEFAKSGEKHIKWGGPNWSQESLLKQYAKMQEYVGYNDPSWTATQRRQFDIEWDAVMKANNEYEWNPKAPDVQALRATGKLQQAAAKQITPLAKSIQKQKANVPLNYGWAEYGRQIRRPVTKKLTEKQARDIFYEAGGNKEIARQLAKERGFEP